MFNSSRSDRAKQKTAQLEDFMDEEEIAELKERSPLPLAFQKENLAAFGSLLIATSGATID